MEEGKEEGGCISCVAGEGGKLSLFVKEQNDETRSRYCFSLILSIGFNGMLVKFGSSVINILGNNRNSS